MAGFDAGRVRVGLKIENDVVAAANVACERPDVVAVLHGRPADEAVQLVPLIYSLCGQAQGIAARLALAAARGQGTAAHADGRAAAEAMREHAWKLLVDWPKALGLVPDEALFVRVAKMRPGDGVALAAEVRARPLFAAACDPLLSERIAARGAELLALLEGGTSHAGCVVAEPRGVARGCAQVMTARGELRHQIALDGDRVASYAIEAPTDRLFGPESPLPGMLLGLPSEQAGAAAGRLVMALDPCVPWELVID